MKSFVYESGFELKISPGEVSSSSATFLGESGSATLALGEAFLYTVPEGEHPEGLEFSYKVDLGPAAVFAKYSKGSRLISIEAGATTAANAGSYTIKAILIDVNGVQSSAWTLDITIEAPEEEEVVESTFNPFDQVKKVKKREP